MTEIARIDIEWQGATGVSTFMRSLIDHPAAARLLELMHAEGHASAGSRALLDAIYAARGMTAPHSMTAPREPAVRDPIARW